MHNTAHQLQLEAWQAYVSCLARPLLPWNGQQQQLCDPLTQYLIGQRAGCAYPLRSPACIPLQEAGILELVDPSVQKYTRFKTMPFLRFPVFLGGPRRVWGVTAFILDMALMILLPERFNYTPIAARRDYSCSKGPSRTSRTTEVKGS